MIVTTQEEARLRAVAHRHGVPCARLGEVGGDRLALQTGNRVLAEAPVARLHEAFMSLERALS
jgi:hypothetical protein